jgi:hypothetical protein
MTMAAAPSPNTMNKLNGEMWGILSKFKIPDMMMAKLWQNIKGSKSLSKMSHGTSFDIGCATEVRLKDMRRLTADWFWNISRKIIFSQQCYF